MIPLYGQTHFEKRVKTARVNDAGRDVELASPGELLSAKMALVEY